MHLQNTNRWIAFFKDDTVCSWLRLAAAWIPGLVAGVFIGFGVAGVFAPYLQSAYSSCASLLGLVFGLSVPLLFTVVMEHCFGYASILLVVFLKAFSFSVSVTTCVISCDSAGWLISKLLFFSDFFGILVFLWLWMQILRKKQLVHRTLLVAFALILIVASFDYFIVSPFLSSLFYF